MLGRGFARRVPRLQIHTRLALRPAPFQCQLAQTAPIQTSQRTYATPGRPRKAVGEPSGTVKRAVKRAAKKPATGKRAASTKKGAPKKKASTSKAAKKPKKKAKRELTEEQKAKAQLRSDRARIRELKKTALSPPPKIIRGGAWNSFIKEKASGRGTNIVDRTKALAEEFKNITPAEREHYNHLHHSANEARAAEYKSWVESHTPEQIKQANAARAVLKRKLPESKSRKWSPIKDERQVKRPSSAYIEFSTDRSNSGDFKGIHFVDRAKLITSEWKALSDNEKKKYVDLSAQNVQRYTNEYKTVYGHMPPNVNNISQQTVSV